MNRQPVTKQFENKKEARINYLLYFCTCIYNNEIVYERRNYLTSSFFFLKVPQARPPKYASTQVVPLCCISPPSQPDGINNCGGATDWNRTKPRAGDGDLALCGSIHSLFYKKKKWGGFRIFSYCYSFSKLLSTALAFLQTLTSHTGTRTHTRAHANDTDVKMIFCT